METEVYTPSYLFWKGTVMIFGFSRSHFIWLLMHQSRFPQAIYFLIGMLKVWTNPQVVWFKIFFPQKKLVLRTVPWSRCSVGCFHVTALLWMLYGQLEVTENQRISLSNCKVLLIMTRKYVKCKSIFNLHICPVKPQQVSF